MGKQLEAHRATATRFIEAFNTNDWDAVRDVVAKEYVFHHPVGGTVPAGGLDLTFNLEGTGTETVFFAFERGMVLSIESVSLLEGAASNTDMGISFPMKHDFNNRLDVVFE